MKVEIEVTCVTERTEIEAALELWREVSSWLESVGQPLWKTEQFTLDYGLAQAGRGELYLAWDQRMPVGVYLLQEEDAFFWPSVPVGESLFVHRLAVARSFAGQGVARQMLDWAGQEGVRRKKTYLRLDCDGDRPQLCDIYLSAGFDLRDKQTRGRYTIARFERYLGEGE